MDHKNSGIYHFYLDIYHHYGSRGMWALISTLRSNLGQDFMLCVDLSISRTCHVIKFQQLLKRLHIIKILAVKTIPTESLSPCPSPNPSVKHKPNRLHGGS